MAKTIAIRVSERNFAALRRGRSVRVRLGRANVVAGVPWPTGRPPGRKARRKSRWWHAGRLPRPDSLAARLLLWVLENGGRVDNRTAERVLRRGRLHASGELSKLAAAGLLRRENVGRYVVTAKGRAARGALRQDGPYAEGSHRARVLDWARRRRRTFGISDVATLLGVTRDSVSVVLHALLRDRFVVRVRRGVYRATDRKPTGRRRGR